MAIDFSNQHSDDAPYGKYNYEVEIDGTAIAGFTQISGINVRADVVEYREGGVHTSTHKFPDSLSHSNVRLHRGVTDHDDFIRWVTESMIATRADAQKDVIIRLHDKQGKAVWGWKLLRSFPVQWTGPELAAQSGDRFAMELVELACEEVALIK